MPTNLSMFQNAFMQPKSVAEYANDFGQIQNNALARTQSQMQIDAAKRATQQEDAYNQLAKGFGTDIQSNVNALRQGGLGARADTYLKATQDAQEKAAKTSKDRAEAEATKYKLQRTKYENGIIVLVGSQTPQDAIARINKGVTDGAWSMQEAQQKIGEIPQDPNQFQDWRQRELLGIVSAKDQIDHALSLQQLDETVRHNTTSEGIMERNNIRSNKRMSANAGGGAGGVANAGGAPAKPAKPLPVAALKMQQDSLDAIGTAGGINADLGAVLQQVESGSLQLGPVKNAVGSVRNTLGVSNENSQNLATFKATLEKLRNDSLRLNKGVQTDGDAQRAWNELLSNINDPGVVAKRLKEIRSLNSRAIELHNDNLGNIRSNYGAQPIDTTKRATQKPAIESAVKRINSDEEYNALPSGATFIDPDGKTRRKP